MAETEAHPEVLRRNLPGTKAVVCMNVVWCVCWWLISSSSSSTRPTTTTTRTVGE